MNEAQVMGQGLSVLSGLIESKQWNEAQAEFNRLRGEGAQSAEFWLMGSRIAFGQQDWYGARNLAEKAMAALTPADSPKRLGQIRFHLGMAAREIGDISVALEQFDRFLAELPEKYPELQMAEASAHCYRGMCLRQQKDYDEALKAYQASSTCCRRDGLISLLCLVNQNTAWLLCKMPCIPDRLVLAWICLREAAPLVKRPVEQWHQTLGEAHLFLLEGNYAMAIQLCESLFNQAAKGEPVTDEVRSQAAWITAKAALYQHDFDSSAALAKAALRYAATTKDSRLINDANEVLAEIGQAGGGETHADN